MILSEIKKLSPAARRGRGGDQGFTLVELMVVVLVIAILLAIAIPTFLGARERSQDRAAQSNLRNALTAAKVAFSNDGDYENAGEGATELPIIEPRLDYVVGTAVSTTEREVSVSNPVGVWNTTGICFSDTTHLSNSTANATCVTNTGMSWGHCWTISATLTIRQPAYTGQAACTTGYALWSGAVWSESEACFFISDNAEAAGDTGGTRYGSGDNATNCVGNNAQASATNADW